MILIITSANIQQDFEDRKNDYIESYSIINNNYRQYFSSITLLESIETMEYQNVFNFNEIIKYDNKFINKGLNELRMIYLYFKDNQIDDFEDFIKLTGRYHIIDNTLLVEDISNFDFIGKKSDDMYPDTEGVHSFYYSMKVGKLKEFYEYLLSIENFPADYPIEIELNNYIQNWKSKLIDHLGIFAKPYPRKDIYKLT